MATEISRWLESQKTTTTQPVAPAKRTELSRFLAKEEVVEAPSAIPKEPGRGKKDVVIPQEKVSPELIASQEFYATHTLLSDGNYVSNEEFSKLNSEEQAKLKELGIDKFNDWYGIRKITESGYTQLKALDAEGKPIWVKTEDYAKLLPEEQANLSEWGPGDKFNSWYSDKKAVEAGYVKTGVDEWVKASDIADLSAEDRAKLIELGVAKFNEWSKEHAKEVFLQQVADAKAAVDAKIASVTPKAIPVKEGSGIAKGFTGSQYIRTARGDIPAWMLVADMNGAFTPNGAEAMGTSYGPSIMGVKYAIQDKQEYRISSWGYASIGSYPIYSYKYRDKATGEMFWSSGDPYTDYSTAGGMQRSRIADRLKAGEIEPVNWTEDTYLAYVGVPKDKAKDSALSASYRYSDLFYNQFFESPESKYNYIDPETGKVRDTEGLVNPYGLLDESGKVVRSFGYHPQYGSGVWTQAARTAFQGTDIGSWTATGRISDLLTDPRSVASASQRVAQAAKTFQTTGKLPEYPLMKQVQQQIMAQLGAAVPKYEVAAPVEVKPVVEIEAERAWDDVLARARAGLDVGGLKDATDAFLKAEEAAFGAMKKLEQKHIPGEWTSKAKTFMTDVEKRLGAPGEIARSAISGLKDYIQNNNVKVLPSGEMVSGELYNKLANEKFRNIAQMEKVIADKYVVTSDGKDLIPKAEMVDGKSERAKIELRVMADEMLAKMKDQTAGWKEGAIPPNEKVDYDTIEFTPDGKVLFETYHNMDLVVVGQGEYTMKSSDFERLTPDEQNAWTSRGDPGLKAYQADIKARTTKFESLAKKELTFDSLIKDIADPKAWTDTDIRAGLVGQANEAYYNKEGWNKLFDDVLSGRLSTPGYQFAEKPIEYTATKQDTPTSLDKIDSMLSDTLREAMTLGMDVTPTYDPNKFSQEYDALSKDYAKEGQKVPFSKEQYIGMTLQNQLPLIELGAQMMPFEYFRPGRSMAGLNDWQKVVMPVIDVVSLIPLVGLAGRGLASGAKAVSLGARIAAAGGREALEYAAKQAALNIPKAVAKTEFQVLTKEIVGNLIESASKSAGKITAEKAAQLVASQIKNNTEKLLKLATEMGSSLDGLVGKSTLWQKTAIQVAMQAKDAKVATTAAKYADDLAGLAQKELATARSSSNMLQDMLKGADTLKAKIGEKAYVATDKLSRVLTGDVRAVEAGTREALATKVVGKALKGGDIGASAVISSMTIENWDQLPPESRAAGLALGALSLGIAGPVLGGAWRKGKEYLLPDVVPGKAMYRGYESEFVKRMDPEKVKTLRITLTEEQMKSPEVTMSLKYVRDSAQEQVSVEGKPMGVSYFVTGDQAEDFAKWHNDVVKVGHPNLLTPEMKEALGLNPNTIRPVMLMPEDYAKVKVAVEKKTGKVGLILPKPLEPAEFYAKMMEAQGVPIKLEKIDIAGSEIVQVTGKPTIASGSPFADIWLSGQGDKLQQLMLPELKSTMTMLGKEAGAYFSHDWLAGFSQQAALASQKAAKPKPAAVLTHFDQINALPPSLEKIRVIEDMEASVNKHFNDINKPVPIGVINGFKKYKQWLEFELVITNGTELARLENFRTKFYKLFGKKVGSAKTYLPTTGEAVEIIQYYVDNVAGAKGLTISDIYKLKGKALKNELRDIKLLIDNRLQQVKKERFGVISNIVNKWKEEARVGETPLSGTLKTINAAEENYLASLGASLGGSGKYVKEVAEEATKYAESSPVVKPPASKAVTVEPMLFGATAKADIDIPDANKIVIKNLERDLTTGQLDKTMKLGDRAEISIEVTSRGRYPISATINSSGPVYINGRSVSLPAEVRYGDYIRVGDNGFTFEPKDMYLPPDVTSTISPRLKDVQEWIDNNIDRIRNPLDRVNVVKEVGDEIGKPIIDIGNATDHELGMFLANLVSGGSVPADVDFVMVGHANGFGDNWNVRGIRMQDLVNRSAEPGKKVYVVACDDFNKRSAVRADGITLSSEPRAVLPDGKEVPVTAKEDWIPESKKPVLRNESLRKDTSGKYTRDVIPVGEYGEFRMELTTDQTRISLDGSKFELREGVKAYVNGKEVHAKTIDLHYGDYIRFEDDFGVSFMPEDLSPSGIDEIINSLTADMGERAPLKEVALTEETRFKDGDIVDVAGEKVVIEQGAVEPGVGEVTYLVHELDGSGKTRIVKESEIGGLTEPAIMDAVRNDNISEINRLRDSDEIKFRDVVNSNRERFGPSKRDPMAEDFMAFYQDLGLDTNKATGVDSLVNKIASEVGFDPLPGSKINNDVEFVGQLTGANATYSFVKDELSIPNSSFSNLPNTIAAVTHELIHRELMGNKWADVRSSVYVPLKEELSKRGHNASTINSALHLVDEIMAIEYTQRLFGTHNKYYINKVYSSLKDLLGSPADSKFVMKVSTNYLAGIAPKRIDINKIVQQLSADPDLSNIMKHNTKNYDRLAEISKDLLSESHDMNVKGMDQNKYPRLTDEQIGVIQEIIDRKQNNVDIIEQAYKDIDNVDQKIYAIREQDIDADHMAQLDKYTTKSQILSNLLDIRLSDLNKDYVKGTYHGGAVPTTMSPLPEGAALDRFKNIDDAAFEALAAKGEIRPFGEGADEMVAVKQGKKPMALVFLNDKAAIDKAAELGLMTHEVFSPGGRVVVDGKFVTKEKMLLAFRPEDTNAVARYFDFLNRYENYSSSTVPYHVEFGELLGYSDADIAAFIKKSFTDEAGSERMGSFVRKMAYKDEPMELRSVDRYRQLNKEIMAKGRELAEVDAEIKKGKPTDKLLSRRTKINKELRDLNTEYLKYEKALEDFTRKRGEAFDDFFRRQSPEFRSRMNRRAIMQELRIAEGRLGRIGREELDRKAALDERLKRMGQYEATVRIGEYGGELRPDRREEPRVESRISAEPRMPREEMPRIEGPARAEAPRAETPRAPREIAPRTPETPRGPERPATPPAPRGPEPRPAATPPPRETPPVRGREAPPPRETPPNKIRIKLPDGKEIWLTQSQIDGAIAWKQGWCYKMLYPPYGRDNILNTRSPLEIVKYSSGPGSAYASVVAKGADIPPNILRDMGVFDIGFSVPDVKSGQGIRKATIRYRRDPQNVYTGIKET